VIAGHFGLAAAVKAREPQVPLWALMLATQGLDVVFVPLYLAHAERLVPVAGTGGGYGNAIIHADYTHSLVGAVALAALFALPALWRWGRRTALVLGAVVFSHWLIDLVVHRHDMPLLPGAPAGFPSVGFGLWRQPVAAAIAELALVLWGTYSYWRAAVATTRTLEPARLPRAHIAAAALLVSALVTLGLDLLGT
jgi:membrane-bound metal-dependent hydrolase YbcI (DUF457 family)